MTQPVTFYGHFSGNSSYPTVCKAIARFLDGHVPLTICNLRDSPIDEELRHIARLPDATHAAIQACAQNVAQTQQESLYRASTAPGVGLVFGFPDWLPVVSVHERMVGYHVSDVDRVPPYWVSFINDYTDHLVVPSAWCRGTFRAEGVTRPITVVHHGVDVAFAPGGSSRTTDAETRFVHFCSAQRCPERKGTPQVLKAFEHLTRLFAGGPHSISLDVITPVSAKPLAPNEMADRLQEYDVVVAPSRAEGFGMIPLEALASGIPVIATTVTGHAEYLCDNTPGVVPVLTGPGMSMCGGLGNAPDLSSKAVLVAMLDAIVRLDSLAVAARSSAARVWETWQWEKVLVPLLDVLS